MVIFVAFQHNTKENSVVGYIFNTMKHQTDAYMYKVPPFNLRFILNYNKQNIAAFKNSKVKYIYKFNKLNGKGFHILKILCEQYHDNKLVLITQSSNTWACDRLHNVAKGMRIRLTKISCFIGLNA